MISSLRKLGSNARLIHAVSSQMYTPMSQAHVINEASEKRPSTFYGYTKKSGLELIDHYRERSGFNGCSAILFNHESIYRTPDFLTRTISVQVAKIALGIQDKLHLRNIGAAADFSAAEDIVDAIIRMSHIETPENMVVASAQSTTVKQLLTWAFERIDCDWQSHVEFEKDEEAHYLLGDNTKLRNLTDWQPSMTMKHVIQGMVDFDLEQLQK